MKKVLLLASLIFAATAYLHADYIENVSSDGYVDWTNGIIRAKGVGYPSEFSEGTVAENKLAAKQAAKTDAIRKLAETVNNIRIDGKTFVKDFQAQNEEVSSHIQAFVKNCAEKEVNYLPEGRCEVVVEASLNGEGSLSHIIYDNLKVTDASGEFDEQEKKLEPEQVDEGKVVIAKEDAVEVEEVVEENYTLAEKNDSAEVVEEVAEITETPEKEEEVKEDGEVVEQQDSQEKKRVLPSFVSGLVVDAKGTSAKPAINPSIISDTGEKLYNMTVPNRRFRTRQGLTSYTAEVQTAETNNRVTKTPYVIEAIKIVQENPCVIMVSQEEFDEFKKLRGSDLVLERAKVIIVVGK